MTKRESFLRSIGASILWQGLDRIAGLAKHIVIAGAIGLTAQLDVFYLGMAILGVLVFTWGRLISFLAVPNTVAYHSAGQKKELDSLTGGMFTLSILSGLGLCLLFLVALDPISKIPVGLNAERRDLLEESLLWFLPVVALYVPMRFLGALFRSVRRFSLFYHGEAIIALTTLSLVALFHDRPKVLFWSFATAVVFAFLYLLARAAGSFQLIGRPLSTEVRGTLRHAPKLLLLHGAVYLYQLSDNIFISFLKEGAIGALGYGWTLMAVLPRLLGFGGGFMTVFAERRRKGENGADIFNDLISLSVLIGIPASLFLIVRGEGIIAFLLERGVFSSQDTALTARALVGYSIGMVPLLLIPPCDQVFQVLNRLELQTRRVVAGLAVNVALNWLFLFRFGWGVWGIALATSVSYTCMLLLALQGIHSLGVRVAWLSHLRWLLTVLGAAFAALWITGLAGLGGASQWLVLPHGFAYLAVFACLIVLLPLREVRLLRQTLRRVLPGSRAR